MKNYTRNSVSSVVNGKCRQDYNPQTNVHMTKAHRINFQCPHRQNQIHGQKHVGFCPCKHMSLRAFVRVSFRLCGLLYVRAFICLSFYMCELLSFGLFSMKAYVYMQAVGFRSVGFYRKIKLSIPSTNGSHNRLFTRLSAPAI